jgi:hypothetical protein
MKVLFGATMAGPGLGPLQLQATKDFIDTQKGRQGVVSSTKVSLPAFASYSLFLAVLRGQASGLCPQRPSHFHPPTQF